jgi:hypothetical protein
MTDFHDRLFLNITPALGKIDDFSSLVFQRGCRIVAALVLSKVATMIVSAI